jgi:hypothetical protein
VLPITIKSWLINADLEHGNNIGTTLLNNNKHCFLAFMLLIALAHSIMKHLKYVLRERLECLAGIFVELLPVTRQKPFSRRAMEFRYRQLVLEASAHRHRSAEIQNELKEQFILPPLKKTAVHK